MMDNVFGLAKGGRKRHGRWAERMIREVAPIKILFGSYENMCNKEHDN